ncbi:hypothetical protein FKM82_026668 [Ascaphus truei]
MHTPHWQSIKILTYFTSCTYYVCLLLTLPLLSVSPSTMYICHSRYVAVSLSPSVEQRTASPCVPLFVSQCSSLSLCPPVCLSVCHSPAQCSSLSLCPPVCPSVSLSPAQSPSLRLSVPLSPCMSLSLSSYTQRV